MGALEMLRKAEGMRAAPLANGRDQAIDILRGLALVTITINHLTGIAFRTGLQGMPFPTLSHWGFSSAAEIFFLISGYLVGAIYLRADRAVAIETFAAKMMARAGRLYLYNGLLFLLILPLCWLSPRLARLSFFSHFIQGGAPAWLGFATIYIQPYCLEILAIYIVMLLAAPLFAWGLLRRPLVSMGLSLGLYVCAYQYVWLMLPGGTPAGDWRWNFSPASWQFLFFGAMAAGRYRLLDRLRALFLRDWRWFAGAAALFAVLTLIFVAQEALEPFDLDFWVWGQSKVRVGPIRILHALSVCWLVLGIFWLWPSLQRQWLARQAARIGSCSLQAFVASVVITYAAGLIWIEFTPTYRAYIALCIVSTVALGGFAWGYRIWNERPAFRLAAAQAA
jgi:hypothetical protein